MGKSKAIKYIGFFDKLTQQVIFSQDVIVNELALIPKEGGKNNEPSINVTLESSKRKILCFRIMKVKSQMWSLFNYQLLQ